MYKYHPSFISPDDKKIKIWRYMDLAKLLHLLHTNTLYHRRINLFDDPFEGYIPKTNIDTHNEIEQWISDTFFDGEPPKIKITTESESHFARNMTYANCWHINNVESDAMWKLYIKNNEGVAIQTTFERLCKSITDERSVYAGKVEYIDYQNHVIARNNIFNSVSLKRKSFEHERELRTVSAIFPKPDPETLNPIFSEATGMNIKIDTSILIENIYIAPTCEQWFVDVVRDSLQRHGVNLEPIQSAIYSKPNF
ncbi:DUF2971 domain-containing protein [Raoultella ornithinolytica]|uniref:DUF2971 domain-containing protein n=1 Tax=Raoultella ornithinolytica TaxID=54291 RepID=UPI000FDA0B60|nr:DUF2971 domain-containing protein [Raoultella ornithinolytica]RVS13535.1 DUF2971 domain-containing protein [Raoultella ornithinolytica]